MTRDLKTIAQEVSDLWVRGDIPPSLMAELRVALKQNEPGLDAREFPSNLVPIPQNIEQANGMLLVADAWLQAHADSKFKQHAMRFATGQTIPAIHPTKHPK